MCLSPPIHFTSRQKEPGTHHSGLSGPFDMRVPGWGVWPVQAQKSKCKGKHMQNTAVDLILTLITTPSFPHHWTSWRPWSTRKEKSAESTGMRTSGHGKAKVIPWGRKLNPLPLCWGDWKKASSHCVWIPITSATEFCKEPCLVGTGRCRAKSSSFYSNWYSNRLRAESSFWPLAT